MKNQYRMLFSRYTINMWYSGAALLSPVTDDPFTPRWAEGQILPSPVGESPGGGAEPGCGADLQGNVPTWAGTTADISRESSRSHCILQNPQKHPKVFPDPPTTAEAKAQDVNLARNGIGASACARILWLQEPAVWLQITFCSYSLFFSLVWFLLLTESSDYIQQHFLD